MIERSGVSIKIEPNHVIRGSVYSPEKMTLSPAAHEFFEKSVKIQTLSLEDLYGGIINKSASSTINAINNWWGDESGPFHPELNPNGNDYCPVSDNVEFDPWIGKEN